MAFTYFKFRIKIEFASLLYFNLFNFPKKVTSYNENFRGEVEKIASKCSGNNLIFKYV